MTVELNTRYFVGGVSHPDPFLVPSQQLIVSMQWINVTQFNPGCAAYLYVGTADGQSVVQIVATRASSQINTEWAQFSGYWTSADMNNLTFNVRLTCTSIIGSSRTYYFDDLEFTPAPL
jgi:hypothetical protein